MIRRFRVIAVLFAVFALAGACGSGGSGGGNGSNGSDNGSDSGKMSVTIISPSQGQTVKMPFWVKFKTNFPIGDPSTGRHHIHIWFDGKDTVYTLGYKDKVQISSDSPLSGTEQLSNGKHTMTLSIRNPDHSAVGIDKSETITVAGGSSDNGGPAPAPSTKKSSGGYDYGNGY